MDNQLTSTAIEKAERIYKRISSNVELFADVYAIIDQIEFNKQGEILMRD